MQTKTWEQLSVREKEQLARDDYPAFVAIVEAHERATGIRLGNPHDRVRKLKEWHDLRSSRQAYEQATGAPSAAAPAPTATPRVSGKRWEDLSIEEKHTLAETDYPRFAALVTDFEERTGTRLGDRRLRERRVERERGAAKVRIKSTDKPYSAMTPWEKDRLWRTDPARFERLRAEAQELGAR